MQIIFLDILFVHKSDAITMEGQKRKLNLLYLVSNSRFLPGESQGRGSPVGCRLWGCTESAMTDLALAVAAAVDTGCNIPDVFWKICLKKKKQVS